MRNVIDYRDILDKKLMERHSTEKLERQIELLAEWLANDSRYNDEGDDIY